jgi:hypothetical protein
MRVRHSLAASILLLSLGMAISCDKDRNSIPLRPSSVATSLQIVSPPSIEPGASVQFTANLISGASVENVTDKVNWSTSDISVLQINAAGLATAAQRGEVIVRVTYVGRTATAPLMVIPTGTYRLDGKISDGGFSIPGVAVTVVEGTGEGQTANTSDNGEYVLYGVAGAVTLRATKSGYQERIERLEVGAHRSLSFEMALAGRRLDLSGTYVLTLAVQDPCANLPAELRQRAYEASVLQDDLDLTVRLRGGDFIVVDDRGDRFKGSIRPDNQVVFSIGDDFFPYYSYYTTPNPGFVERLGDSSSLVVIGSVKAKGTQTVISGALIGTIGTVARTEPPFWPFSTLCHSAEHRFEMKRK